jgi:hypothetical protein
LIFYAFSHKKKRSTISHKQVIRFRIPLVYYSSQTIIQHLLLGRGGTPALEESYIALMQLYRDHIQEEDSISIPGPGHRRAIIVAMLVAALLVVVVLLVAFVWWCLCCCGRSNGTAAEREGFVLYSNLENNHDDAKHRHSTRGGAEAEVGRMQRAGYRGSDRLNAYYNRDRKGWYVGKSSLDY